MHKVTMPVVLLASLAGGVGASIIHKPIPSYHGCPLHVRGYRVARFTGIAKARRAAAKRNAMKARAPK